MTEKFIVEIISYGGSILLYEEFEGSMVCIGVFATNYALDKEMLLALKSQIEIGKPFISSERGRSFYKIDDDLGEAFKLLIKSFTSLPNLKEKLIFLERTQFFTLLEQKKYKELADNMRLFYIGRKIEQ